ncbi:13042_t:CDS:1, partial [Dentiscutata erythropus]
MKNNSVSREARRKRKSKKSKTSQQRKARLAHECERKWQKKMQKTSEECEVRMSRERDRKRKEREMETNEQHEEYLNYQRHFREQIKQQNLSRIIEELDPIINTQRNCSHHQTDINTTNIEAVFSAELTEIDRDLLKKFRTKMNNLKHTLCPVCNKCFPSIVLVKGECRCCYNEKSTPKKFSAENNMDPSDMPKELKGLTEIEEMLIAQVFPVMSVYRLRGGQLGYRGNVINFPQDIREFTTRLPRHPSSLDILIVRRQSGDSTSFRDFNFW